MEVRFPNGSRIIIKIETYWNVNAYQTCSPYESAHN